MTVAQSLKSNATKWFEREIEKTKQQLKDCEPYQNLLWLQSALEFSKKLDAQRGNADVRDK